VPPEIAGEAHVLWRSANRITAVDKTVPAPAPGTYFRGRVIITNHTISTWTKSFLYGTGAAAVGDIGPNTAILSPGA
jgi:hypothetical protein